MSANDIICVDIETTDLNPIAGDVIQIGAVRIDKTFTAKKKDYLVVSYIKPLTTHRNSEAMLCNNIPEESLVDGYELNEALEMFENFCGKSKKLAAWGAYFDVPFLKEQYKKINRPWPFSHVTIDLKTIATWELAKRNIFITGLSDTLAKLNLTFEGRPHDALSDINNTVRIITTLRKQRDIRTMQTGWCK